MDRTRRVGILLAPAVAAAWVLAGAASADDGRLPGEQGRLGPRITQEMITGELSLKEIRAEGQRIFTTQFNSLDGLGDGPMNPADPVTPGGRPTLEGNGSFLRLNGLDSQSCNECHSIVSNAFSPPLMGVGGVGGAAANAFPGVLGIDVPDDEGNGFAAMFGGRSINPPFLFGSGGIELLAKEMTAQLQELKAEALTHPGRTVRLSTKGVSFGSIVAGPQGLDTSAVEGIDADLVVRPFGRKGEFATVRAFDLGALQFHHGIQPVESVGENHDADGDGVVNEITVGEVSALHIHNVLLERPHQTKGGRTARAGARLFREIGCAGCHVPELKTRSTTLTLSVPEVETDPSANVYASLDLTKLPRFRKTREGGIQVPLYADLKRHDMGPELAENTGGALDPWFTTARLWGVADTDPYLHDGRATTLSEAILWHGGEAQTARDRFEGLRDHERVELLTFLRTLRTPGLEKR